jgi:hypothetical protein
MVKYSETARLLNSERSPRPRMRPVVDLLQLCGGELRVALRGGEALVAEKLLDGAQVGAFLQ